MNEQTPEAQQRAALEMQLAQHARDVNRVVQQGRERYGKEFDEASAEFSKALGERTQSALAMAMQFDRPIEVIQHLANNPRRLQEFAKLPDARQMTEIAKIEAEASPYGRAEAVSGDPAWKSAPANSSRVSDDEWRVNAGSRLSDDQWNREFDRRMADRSRGVR